MMKIKYKKRKSKKLFFSVPFISILLILMILCFSISYAKFSETLTIEGKITGEVEPTEYKYYFKKPSTWSSPTPYAHMWNDNTGITTTWPGVPMVDEGNNIYSITVDPSIGYEYVMFTNGKTNVNGDENVKSQHLDLKNCNGYIFYPNIKSEKTIYFEDWYQWGNIHVHTWITGDSDRQAAWPGLAATLCGETTSNHSLYSYTIDPKYKYAIFNNNGKGQQTGNLNISDADGAIWGIFTGSDAWHWELHGSWEKYK